PARPISLPPAFQGANPIAAIAVPAPGARVRAVANERDPSPGNGGLDCSKEPRHDTPRILSGTVSQRTALRRTLGVPTHPSASEGCSLWTIPHSCRSG